MTRFEGSGNEVIFHYARPDTSLGAIVERADSTGRTTERKTDQLDREILRLGRAFDGTSFLATTTFYDAGTGKAGFISRPFTTPAVGPAVNPPGDGTTLSYDSMGRLTMAQPPGEAARTLTYAGLKTTEFLSGVEKGYRVDDGTGRIALSSSINPTSSNPNHEVQTGYDYGPFGTMRHVYEPGGATVTIQHDHLARRTELDDPDSGARIVHYNGFGETVREELAGQDDLIYGRDGLGRLTSLAQGLRRPSISGTRHKTASANWISRPAGRALQRASATRRTGSLRRRRGPRRTPRFPSIGPTIQPAARKP